MFNPQLNDIYSRLKAANTLFEVCSISQSYTKLVMGFSQHPKGRIGSQGEFGQTVYTITNQLCDGKEAR